MHIFGEPIYSVQSICCTVKISLFIFISIFIFTVVAIAMLVERSFVSTNFPSLFFFLFFLINEYWLKTFDSSQHLWVQLLLPAPLKQIDFLIRRKLCGVLQQGILSFTLQDLFLRTLAPFLNCESKIDLINVWTMNLSNSIIAVRILQCTYIKALCACLPGRANPDSAVLPV